MAEYEDAYPDAHGRREETDTASKFRRFLNFGLPRQVRDKEPAVAEARRDAPQVVNIEEPAPQQTPLAPTRHVERPRQSLVHRTAREICDDVHEALTSSPFIDTSGIVITVDDSDVMLDGTINSLIAISLAKALTTGVPGVSRVEVRLRVRPARRTYETPAETPGAPVYKIAAE
jgi:BON domain-containing protein